MRHETTAYQAGEDGEAKIATLVRLVEELNTLSSPERLAAVNIMNKFISNQTDLPDLASPSSPPHYERIPCLTDASPHDEKRSPKVEVKNESSMNTSQQQDNGNNSNQVPFAVTAIQYVEMPVNTKNTVNHNEHPPIEWIRDKADDAWMVDRQDDDFMVAHRSGLRGYTNIPYSDVKEFHYKKDKSEVQT